MELDEFVTRRGVRLAGDQQVISSLKGADGRRDEERMGRARGHEAEVLQALPHTGALVHRIDVSDGHGVREVSTRELDAYLARVDGHVEPDVSLGVRRAAHHLSEAMELEWLVREAGLTIVKPQMHLDGRGRRLEPVRPARREGKTGARRLRDLEDVARRKHLAIAPLRAEGGVCRIVPHGVGVEAHGEREPREKVPLAHHVGLHDARLSAWVACVKRRAPGFPRRPAFRSLRIDGRGLEIMSDPRTPRPRRRHAAPRHEPATVTPQSNQIELRFQVCPGVFEDVGVSGLRFFLRGVEVAEAGRDASCSHDNGWVRFPAGGPGDRMQVEVRTQGDVSLGELTVTRRDVLPAPGSRAGVRARLKLLGYPSGSENHEEDLELEESMLQFQADHHLALAGVTSVAELGRAPQVEISSTDAARLDGLTEQPAGGSYSAEEPTLGVPGLARIVLARFLAPAAFMTVAGATESPRPTEVDNRGHLPTGVGSHRVHGSWMAMLCGESVTVDVAKHPMLPSGFALAAESEADLVTVGCRDGAFTDQQVVTIQAHDSPGEAVVDLRLGAGGPVAARMRISVWRPIRINLALFGSLGASVNDPATHHLNARYTTAITHLNRVYAQAGIQFHLAHAEDSSSFDLGAEGATRGRGSAPEAEQRWAGIRRVLLQKHYADCLNIHVIPDHLELLSVGQNRLAALGVGFRGRPLSPQPGFGPLTPDGPPVWGIVAAPIAFTDQTTLAHEVGHYFGLMHPNECPPSSPGGANRYRVAIWDRRRLMMGTDPGSMVPPWGRDQTGRGSLLTLKNLWTRGEDESAGIDDHEVGRLREAAGGHPYDGIAASNGEIHTQPEVSHADSHHSRW
jgi:hypothetical protein